MKEATTYLFMAPAEMPDMREGAQFADEAAVECVENLVRLGLRTEASEWWQWMSDHNEHFLDAGASAPAPPTPTGSSKWAACLATRLMSWRAIIATFLPDLRNTPEDPENPDGRSGALLCATWHISKILDAFEVIMDPLACGLGEGDEGVGTLHLAGTDAR